jgi:hypothetical protein
MCSLVAQRLCPVVAVVCEWFSDRVPSLVMSRYTSSSNVRRVSSGQDLVDVSDAWVREG